MSQDKKELIEQTLKRYAAEEQDIGFDEEAPTETSNTSSDEYWKDVSWIRNKYNTMYSPDAEYIPQIRENCKCPSCLAANVTTYQGGEDESLIPSTYISDSKIVLDGKSRASCYCSRSVNKHHHCSQCDCVQVDLTSNLCYKCVCYKYGYSYQEGDD